jgi:hypothetical protein
VTLEIKDGSGNLVRRFSSDDKISPVDPKLSIPTYWVRPSQILSAKSGMHRFLWDMHYAPIPGVEPEYPISAVYQNTAPDFTSPWVLPGKYTVTLTANGKSVSQTLNVKMDPRVSASADDLSRQFELSKKLYEAWLVLQPIDERIAPLGKQLEKLKTDAGQKPVAAQIEALNKKLQDLTGTANRRPGAPLSLGVLSRLRILFGNLQEVDMAPTPAVAATVSQVLRESASVIENWNTIEAKDIPELNRALQAAGLSGIEPAR